MISLAIAAVAATSQWTLVCGGDIMLNGLSPSPTRLQAAAPVFKRANVAMANLEIQLTDRRTPTLNKSAADVKARKQYILKADRRNAAYLRPWGFNVLTEGNNHAMDYRWDGLSQSLDALDRDHIAHTGAGRDVAAAWKPARVPLQNGSVITVAAALSFAGMEGARKCTPATKTTPGVATLFLGGEAGKKQLKERIAKLRQKGGPVVLFLHWGVEKDHLPRPYQVELGRACIDAGADLVLGAHPHVLQGGEVYRGKPILYSLGNLINKSTCDVGLADLRFRGRTFVGFKFHPFLNHGGVLKRYSPAEEKAALLRFESLSQQIQAKYPAGESALLESGFAR